MVRAIVLATMLAACSPSSPAVSDASLLFGTDGGIAANDGAQSGTRLKLTWFQFTDGTKQFNAFYDAQLKSLCYPQYQGWADGNNYCTPLNGGTLVYTNSTCTAKALYFYIDDASACPSTVAQYFLDTAPVGCTTLPSQLYQVGAKVTATSYFYKNATTGTCGGANTVTSTDKLYALGTAIPASQLVKLTSSTPEGTGRLGVSYLVSSDGMRFPSFMHDSQINADCDPSYAEDGDTAATCFPRNGSYSFYSHDSACAQPELDLDSTCAAPAFAYTYPSTSCPSDTYTYYPVTAKISGTPLFYQIGSSCIAETSSSSDSYYSLGPALALAPMTYVADTGTDHRVQLIHYTSPEGTHFRDPYKLFDSQMNTECYPETLPDGTIRCVAYGAYVSSYYSNSTCTAPLDVAEIYTGPTTCTAPVIPKYARKSIAPAPGTCDYTTEVHAVTTPHTGKVYTGAPGACSAYTPYEQVLYNVGDVVPLTDFVGAAVTQDN